MYTYSIQLATRHGIAAEALTTHAEAVQPLTEERGLQVPAPKSSVTLFASDTHQSPCHLIGTPLPLQRHHKLLSVTFDPQLIFHIYARVLKEQNAEHLKILKALAGTDWSQQKEMIIMTYKAVTCSKFTYAAPI